MNIEFENNSAPLLEKFLEEREIEAVVMDIDNTLLATHKYYREHIDDLGMDLAEYSLSTKPSDILSKEYKDAIYAIFIREKFKPKLIKDQCKQGLDEYWGEERASELYWLIDEHVTHFYENVPEMFPHIEQLFEILKRYDLKVALHSHAQYEWTRKKSEEIQEVVQMHLPYLATPISKEKDMESWIEAFMLVEKSPENILVMGDNFYADIVPAIEAGCKNLVWIDANNKGIPNDYMKPEGVEILVVSGLEDLVNCTTI